MCINPNHRLYRYILSTKYYVTLGWHDSTSHGLGGDIFTWSDLWPTQNVAQYPLYHVTYTPAKFEIAKFNCLGDDTIIRNIMGRKTDEGPALVMNQHTNIY